MQGFSPPVLVFVQSIERAKELFHELIYDGLNVEVMHSERTQAQRDNIVKGFRSGKVGILPLCTARLRGLFTSAGSLPSPFLFFFSRVQGRPTCRFNATQQVVTKTL